MTEPDAPEAMTFTSLYDVKVPQLPASETLGQRLVRLARQVRASGTRTTATEQPEDDGELAGETAWSPPAPDLDTAVAELSAALAPWLAGTGPRIRIIAAAPASWTEQVVAGWCRTQGCFELVVHPRARQQLQLDLNLDGATPLVVRRLERAFLRTPAGLRFFRTLFDRLASARRPVLLVCDSWCWAYLRRTLQLDALHARALTLAPLTGPELLVALAGSIDDRIRVTVDRPPDGDKPPRRARGETPVDSLMDQLAAQARGNGGIAFELLRDLVISWHSLAGQTRIRVTPFEQRALLDLGSLRELDRFVIVHTLLIHGGLSVDDLQSALPDARRLAGQLFDLQLDSLLECHGDGCGSDDTWTVAARAYPGIRQFVGDRGFMIDDY